MPQQKLFDKKTLDTLKKHPLYSQDGKGDNAVAYARLFHPQRQGAIYLTEYDGDDTFYGYYKETEGEPSGGYDQSEYGYFSKRELENTRSSWGLGYERDTSFKTAKMGDIKAGRGQGGNFAPSSSATQEPQNNFSNERGNTTAQSAQSGAKG